MEQKTELAHKMYCVFAMESIKKMNGNRGKLASMAGHAYLHSFWDAIFTFSFKKIWQAYKYSFGGLAFKITLVVDTVDELRVLEQSYKDVCGTSLVTDAGRTVFGEPTTVCLGIGPIREDLVKDDLTKKNEKIKVLI